MRTRIMTMLAALLLISTGAFAQSGETPLKGDVNEDGKVDVADINAIIKIMKDAGGTVEAPTYYWYVGHVTNSQFENNQLTSVVNGQNSTSNTTGPSTLTMPTTTGDVLVYIYPTIWGTPNIVDDTGYGTGDMGIEEVGLTPPTGYGLRFWDGDSLVRGKTLQITWIK